MTQNAVHIEVLGPIRVLDDDGHDVTPAGALQRRLLALLVLRRGRVGVGRRRRRRAVAHRPPGRPDGRAAEPRVPPAPRRSRASSSTPSDDGYRLDPTTVDVDADRLATAVSDGDDPDALPRRRVLGALAGAGVPRAGRRRRRPARGRRPRRAAGPGAREASPRRRLASRRRRRARRRPRRAGRRANRCGSGRGAADGGAGDERPAGRGAAGLRRLPAHARRRAGHRAVAGAGRPARRAAGGTAPAHRPPAGVAPLPIPATSLVGPRRVGERRCSTAVASAPARDAGRPRRRRQDPPARRDRPPPAGGRPRPAGGAVRAGGRGRGHDGTTSWRPPSASTPGPATPLATRIADVLGDTEVVLLLDNCEHVLEPVAALVEHARRHAARTCTVVATSRERLRVPGEQVCVVPPLSFAADGDGPASSCSSSGPAPSPPASRPTPATSPSSPRSSRRLDGLPLAIELAAARLHTHDLAEVAAGLDQRFALLSSGSRTSTRHGSLGRRGVVVVRTARRRAAAGRSPTSSVFAGPFAVDDAAAVVRRRRDDRSPPRWRSSSSARW